MEQFSNNPSSTITTSGGINTSATTFSVASAGPFPSSGNFRILVDGEIMCVTGVSGTTFTVTRANGGSIAASHAQGASVYGILTAEAMNAAVSIQSAGSEVSDRRVLNFVSGATVADNSGSGRCDITIEVPAGVTYGASSSRPSPGTNGRIYVPSDGVITSLDTGSAWVGLNPFGAPFTIPPTLTNWTSFGGTYGTIADIPGGGLNWNYLNTPAHSQALCGIYRTLSSGTSYAAVCGIAQHAVATNNEWTGLIITDGTKVIGIGRGYDGGPELMLVQWSTFNTFNALVLNSVFTLSTVPVLWFKITNDGTHRTYYVSIDGVNWAQVYQEAYTTFLTETSAGVAFKSDATEVYHTQMNLLSWSGA